MEKVSVDELIEVVGEGLDLRTYEEKLIRAVFRGSPAQLGNAKVRSEVLRRLCMRTDDVLGGQVGRLCVVGGGLLGKLDLTGLSLDFGLKFVATDLPQLVLQDTRLLALELLGGSADGIEADRLELAHDILITDGFRCNGPLTLRSASVGGDLNCDGSEFLPKGGWSIMLDGTRIGGRLYMRKKNDFEFRAATGVYGRNMRVAAGIICTGGKFERELSLTRTRVQGDLRLKNADIGSAPPEPGKQPDAELLLGAMHVTGELSLHETTFHGPMVVLARTRVERSLRWSVERIAPKSGCFAVDLMQARVGYLHDDLDKWHGASARLDGFTFDGVAVRGDGWLKDRKEWLSRQWTNKWSPYPYGQLRAALQNSGYESAARAIAIEREKVRLNKGRLSPLSWLAQWIYRLLLGFGYKPFRFFVIAAIAICIFAYVFNGVEQCGPNETAQQCSGFAVPAAHSPVFNPVLFSLDAFAPIDLGQTGAWKPNGDGYAYLVALETSLGWLFAGLLLGAVTGVLRRD